jgi:hypothetical protein
MLITGTSVLPGKDPPAHWKKNGHHSKNISLSKKLTIDPFAQYTLFV